MDFETWVTEELAYLESIALEPAHLEGLVVQRLFELSKANLSSTDKYNKLAVVQNPRRPTLQYSEILSYAARGEFDILKHSRHNILTKPWSNTTHHQMAREEITRLNVETCCLHAWFDAEDSDIKHMATELELTNPLLASEIWRLYHRQRRVNDVHCVCINRIYSLEGFTSCVPSDVTATDDSLDSVDEVSNKSLL
ncbi:hypothetical protein BDR04DRAFT_1130521 [Suillus decipiens]|nr:hypothetical protein BDR04DRAFT_1130521 [Suillus decipiens]